MLAKINNTLTDEEIEELRINRDSSSRYLTDLERLQLICNHKKPGGNMYSLVDDGDGYVRCTICNARLKLHDITKEKIMESLKPE